jgi:hypothetical protein
VASKTRVCVWSKTRACVWPKTRACAWRLRLGRVCMWRLRLRVRVRLRPGTYLRTLNWLPARPCAAHPCPGLPLESTSFCEEKCEGKKYTLGLQIRKPLKIKKTFTYYIFTIFFFFPLPLTNPLPILYLSVATTPRKPCLLLSIVGACL